VAIPTLENGTPGRASAFEKLLPVLRGSVTLEGMEPTALRLGWEQVAASVREAIEAQLGSQVVVAHSQGGGFSPGLAARCELSDGRRCFIKAVSAEQHPDSPGIYRREARVAAALPAGLPAPRLLHVVDDEGWVAMVFEDVDGRPPELPWTILRIGAAFASLDCVASLATPCPVSGLETIIEQHGGNFDGYRDLAGRNSQPAGLDAWSRRHLDVLAEVEAGWESGATGDSLVHADVRSDNLLVRSDGTMVIVDWPHACIGASWVDKALMLPSIEVDGGPSPEEVVEALDPFRDVAQEVVDALAVALAGWFTRAGTLSEVPAIPKLRSFQRAQGAVARQWVATRLSLR